MQITITHAGLYTKPEIYHQTTPCVFLGLNISGLEYMKIYTPEGKLVTEVQNDSLILIPEEFQLDFSFQAPRKNYIVMCNIDGISWNKQSNMAVLNFGDQQIEVPLTIPVPLLRLEQIQELFQRVLQLNESALPADLKSAELLINSALAEFLEHSKVDSEQKIPEILTELKEKIDSDISFEKSLAEIMRIIPMTEVHLRRLFLKHYQTTPAEYRARLRFAKIRQLLGESDLSFKEIADSVGMKHVTHLYLFLKKQCGMTPAELRKTLRM